MNSTIRNIDLELCDATNHLYLTLSVYSYILLDKNIEFTMKPLSHDSTNQTDSINPITKNLKVTDLRRICKNFGISGSGSKNVILNRLYNHGAMRPNEETREKLPQDEMLNKTSKRSDLEIACRKLNLKTSGNKEDLLRRIRFYKKREIEKEKAHQNRQQDDTANQYSDYKILQTSAQMSAKIVKYRSKNARSVLQVNHSIVDIINHMTKPKEVLTEKKKDTNIENKSFFFDALNLKPTFFSKRTPELDETEKYVDMNIKEDDSTETRDETYSSDSGFDEDSDCSDGIDEEETADIDFKEVSTDNIVLVSGGQPKEETIQNQRAKQGQFFAWGSFQDESGASAKIKFIS